MSEFCEWCTYAAENIGETGPKSFDGKTFGFLFLDLVAEYQLDSGIVPQDYIERLLLPLLASATRDLKHPGFGDTLLAIERSHIKAGMPVPEALRNFEPNDYTKRLRGNSHWRNIAPRQTVVRRFYAWRKDTDRLKLPRHWDIWELVLDLPHVVNNAESLDSKLSDKDHLPFLKESDQLPASFREREDGWRSLKKWYREDRRGLIIHDMAAYAFRYWMQPAPGSPETPGSSDQS